jgi:protease I
MVYGDLFNGYYRKRVVIFFLLRLKRGIMNSKKVLMVISNEDFDPTETAIPWMILKREGYQVVFATPNGKKGAADPIMVTGKGLLFLKYFLKAQSHAEQTYYKMIEDEGFNSPLKIKDLNVEDYEAVILPGGHAKKMRPYLESEDLYKFIGAFSETNKPLAAICHGVLVMARAKSPTSGKPLLYGRKTTALPAFMEKSGFYLTCLWMGKYYLTYDKTEEEEVRESLKNKEDWIRGPFSLQKDSEKNLAPGFVVRDGNYLSARWPGDIHKFTQTLLDMLQERANQS